LIWTAFLPNCTARAGGPGFDLATSHSKSFALAYSFDQGMYMVTEAPTQIDGVTDKSNTIKSRKGALYAFEYESGNFVLKDSTGNELKSDNAQGALHRCSTIRIHARKSRRRKTNRSATEGKSSQNNHRFCVPGFEEKPGFFCAVSAPFRHCAPII
jgi:predicted amidohydrolase